MESVCRVVHEKHETMHASAAKPMQGRKAEVRSGMWGGVTMSMDLVNFVGSAEQCEAIHQFARDYSWDLARGERIEDPEFAADQVVADIVAALEGDPNHDAVERLRVALVQSAIRVNGEVEFV